MSPFFLLLPAALTLAALFVNGWTDAPNAIATVVSSGVLPFRRAALLGAVCNFLGVWFFSLLSPGVTETVLSIAALGPDRRGAAAALAAALGAIVLWGVFAWVLGIPTSESHALLSGVAGGAVALRGLEALSPAACGRVLFGLV